MGHDSRTSASRARWGAVPAGIFWGGTLKFGLQSGSAIDSLDPAIAASAMASHVGRSWGEQLLRQTPAGTLTPLLAIEWNSSPDANAWVFKIRKGVQFHNGKEFTPDDMAQRRVAACA